MVISDHTAAQTRSCSKAKALAAVRDDTPNLVKMFWTWRATVFAYDQVLRDFAVALAGCDETQHLEFSAGQAVPER